MFRALITHPLPAPGEDDKPAEDVSGGLPHIEALSWALVDPTREGPDVGYFLMLLRVVPTNSDCDLVGGLVERTDHHLYSHSGIGAFRCFDCSTSIAYARPFRDHVPIKRDGRVLGG